MRSTPAIDEKLRLRLDEAVTKFADGNTDLFGRKLGYLNGGYIREAISKKKPVREALIERVHGTEEMRGWFDFILTDASGAKTIIQTKAPAPNDSEAFLRAVRQIAAYMSRSEETTRQVTASLLPQIALNPGAAEKTIEMISRIIGAPAQTSKEWNDKILSDLQQREQSDPDGARGNTGSGELDDAIVPLPPAKGDRPLTGGVRRIAGSQARGPAAKKAKGT